MNQGISRLLWLLSIPSAYHLFQNLVGARRARRKIVQEHMIPKPGDRVLDIGCGTGAILEFLPNVEYFGFDMSPHYIAYARKMYGDRGRFKQERLNQVSIANIPPSDLVITTGVLHHLSDTEAVDLMRLARDVLKPGGRLITVDPTRCENRSFIENFQINQDRGQYIRKPEQYRDLAEKVFDSVSLSVHHDLLYVPYSHAVLDAKKP